MKFQFRIWSDDIRAAMRRIDSVIVVLDWEQEQNKLLPQRQASEIIAELIDIKKRLTKIRRRFKYQQKKREQE